MATLGGSLFVRNAIKYDYCVKEAIASLADLCDEVFILDCQSDDGTAEMLAGYLTQFPNVTYQTNGDWNCKPDYFKLSELANMCIAKLKTDWHFMLQADEVIHESSFATIRRLTSQKPTGKKTFSVRRFNLFGDVDHYISLSLPSKPCSDEPVRLGTRGTISKGDAESLEWSNTDRKNTDQILIYHYGYVRKSEINISKAIDMQSWFFGKKSQVDSRLLEMQKTGKWEPYKLIGKDWVTPIPKPHPKYAVEWANERR